MDSIATSLSANIIYHVTVTDAIGNVGNDSIFLSQPPMLNTVINETKNISCFGNSDGQASVVTSGGTMPYIYLWNDSSNTTTSFITGLSANRYYRVIVTDANLCTSTDSITISEPDKVVTTPITGSQNVNESDIIIYGVTEKPSSFFKWSAEGGNILSGQGTNFINVQWGTAGTGQVSVTIVR